MNLPAKRLLLTALISALFAYLLYRALGDTNLQEVAASLDPYYLAWAFAAYVLVAIIRTLRIHAVYADEKYPLFTLFAVSNLHTLISNILPSRLGEFSFVYFMKSVFGQRMSKNTVALIFVRLLDTFVVASFFIVTAFFVGFSDAQAHLTLFVFVLLVLLGVGTFFLETFILFGVNLAKMIIQLVRLDTVKHMDRVLDFLETLTGFGMLKQKGVYGRALVATFLIWVFLMVANMMMVKALGMDLTLEMLVFSSTGAVLTSLIPITSFAALGTYELGWIGAFALVGLGREEAILTGLTVHSINFVFSVVLGLLGLLVIKINGRGNREKGR